MCVQGVYLWTCVLTVNNYKQLRLNICTLHIWYVTDDFQFFVAHTLLQLLILLVFVKKVWGPRRWWLAETFTIADCKISINSVSCILTVFVHIIAAFLPADGNVSYVSLLVHFYWPRPFWSLTVMFSGFPCYFYVLWTLVYPIFCCGAVGWIGEDDKMVKLDWSLCTCLTQLYDVRYEALTAIDGKERLFENLTVHNTPIVRYKS